MSGNKNDGHTVEHTDSGGSLKLMMDLLWIKLEERFNTMG